MLPACYHRGYVQFREAKEEADEEEMSLNNSNNGSSSSSSSSSSSRSSRSSSSSSSSRSSSRSTLPPVCLQPLLSLLLSTKSSALEMFVAPMVGALPGVFNAMNAIPSSVATQRDRDSILDWLRGTLEQRAEGNQGQERDQEGGALSSSAAVALSETLTLLLLRRCGDGGGQEQYSGNSAAIEDRAMQICPLLVLSLIRALQRAESGAGLESPQREALGLGLGLANGVNDKHELVRSLSMLFCKLYDLDSSRGSWVTHLWAELGNGVETAAGTGVRSVYWRL